MGTDKVVIVVKDGMVREVFGACPYNSMLRSWTWILTEPTLMQRMPHRIGFRLSGSISAKSINRKETHYARKEQH